MFQYATPSGQTRRKPREKRQRREATKPATAQSTPELVSSEEEEDGEEVRDAVAAMMKVSSYLTPFKYNNFSVSS